MKSMFSAFIIDDDKYSIEAIYRMMPWEELNVKTIEKITSPIGIVEKIVEENPHIVFIDIELYNISGLDVIRLCRQQHVNSLFVIISGHNDFQYAHAAVELDVIYYILKPIDEDDIKKVTAKLKILLANANPTDMPQENLSVEKANKIWSAFNTYCNENYMKKIQVADICNHLFISRRTFFYVIKKYTDDSFTEFLAKIRVKKAKELLRNTDKTVAEIAEVVGFHDVYYFSHIFKKVTNSSPSSYRKQCQENKSNV